MIGTVVNLIPAAYRFYAGVIAAAVIVAALGVVVYKIETHGYDRRVADEKAALQAAKDKAQEGIAKVEKEYAPRIKELQETPDNNTVVGPITSRAIDGLR
jgi:hypothetical protein